MKGFLKKRWHRIPVALVSALLILVLAAGSAFAAYTFLSGSVKVEVEEAVTVSYQWPGSNVWTVFTNGAELTITDAHPGESATIGIRVANASSADLTINMTATVTAAPDGGWDKITVTGGPAGAVAGHSTWTGAVTGTIAGDAPHGDYTVGLAFTRS